VNRPLRINELHPDDNLNKIVYRYQINKVANAVKEIIVGMRSGPLIADHQRQRSSYGSQGPHRNYYGPDSMTETGLKKMAALRINCFSH
jgi:hypothetical protein